MSIHLLKKLRRSFDANSTQKKLSLLKGLSKKKTRNLLDYHETLLFILAYPDNREISTLASRELKRVAELIKNSKEVPPGLLGSTINYSYTLPILNWLTQKFPNSVDVQWEDESLGEQFDEILPLLAFPIEKDGVDDTSRSLKEWLNASGVKNYLQWILKRLDLKNITPELKEYIFETLDLSVTWKLEKMKATRTFCRFPLKRTYYHRELIKKVTKNPIIKPTLLSKKQTEDLIDACRLTLSLRQREVDTLNYINFKEVKLFRLPRGYDLAMYSMTPSRRLSFDSYFGFVLAKNSIPMGYGGGWIFLDRCEIGINIFETFRGGESAYLFSQILGVYADYFNIKTFTVDPYQIGGDNAEGIDSGAFWFYYRLGFRPMDEKINSLATKEWEKISQNKLYRTPANTLKKLTGCHLKLDLKPNAQDHSLPELSLKISEWIGEKFSGDLIKAQNWSTKRMKKILNLKKENNSFKELSLLFAMQPSFKGWSSQDKKGLGEIMLAKGGPNERSFVLRTQKHSKFRSFLKEVNPQ